jgi:hypothetical protein
VTLALLDGGYRPSLISIEINEKIPTPIYFSVRYVDEHQPRGLLDSFYGCSATAAAQEIKPRGYALDSIHYCNAFFVRSDLSAKNLDVAEAYRAGYVSRSDRRVLFPWNEDFEEWQQIEPARAIASIKSRFAKYDGLYDLRLPGVPD